ncbi:Two pore potassium channel protein sup-9 [Eufriesea mexicana]|uniref:Two pore potassium channel protein sup-9 n=1 Tax=Eufriesea mexicana TaxID=516756 RepID=A0A310S8H8_9HYME|nr:Two pore potassium channel protein sup-9 [Eufriesea mexicana]
MPRHCNRCSTRESDIRAVEMTVETIPEKDRLTSGENQDRNFPTKKINRALRYGHIAPKTKNGKVVTIFYAIVGIPLMLLCLSNIGDIMASSFRFLYWRVCCYICTKPPRRRRPRPHLARSYSMRQPGRYGGSKGGFRRSMRVSQRSADSALGLSEGLARLSYSDVDYNTRRYEDDEQRRPSSYASSGNPNFGVRSATMSRYSDIPVAKSSTASPKMTTQSLDRKLLMRSPNDTDRSPVLCNKYALDDLENELQQWQTSAGSKIGNASKSPEDPEVIGSPENDEKRAPLATRSLPRRCLSVEGATSNYRTNLAPPLRPSSIYLELENSRRSQISRSRRYRRDTLPGDLMSPPGFPVHRQIYVDDFDSDYEYYNDDPEKQPIKPVPIWLCVFLVVSYIFGGAFLFSAWEHWPFLDSAYFCFITLTTIG